MARVEANARAIVPEDDLSDIEPTRDNNDSDADSLFSETHQAEVSPVDGYFQRREHPQDNFVENSSVQAEADSKAQEAARERTSNAHDRAWAAHARSMAAASASHDRAMEAHRRSMATATASHDRAMEAHARTMAANDRVMEAHARTMAANDQTMATHAQTMAQGHHRSSSQSSNPPSSAAWEPEGSTHPDPTAPPPDYQTAISDRSSERSPSHANYGTIDGRSSPLASGSESQRPYASANGVFTASNFPFVQHIAPFFPQGQFGRDHPLVRNGLFSDQSSNRTQPQSMRDSSVPPAEQTASERQDQNRHNESNWTADEEAGLLTSSQPSRKDRGRDEPSGLSSWLCRRGRHQKSGKQASGRTRPSTKTFWFRLLIALCFIIGVSVIGQTTEFSSRHGRGYRSNRPQGADSNDPAYLPDIPSPDETTEDRFCNLGSEVRASVAYDNVDSFHFIEMMQRDGWGDPQDVSGQLSVQLAPDSQEEDIRITVAARTSHEWAIETIDWVVGTDSFELVWPQLRRVSISNSRGCLRIDVLVQLRSGLTVKNMDFSTAHLSFRSYEGIFHKQEDDARDVGPVHVSGTTSVSTTSGRVQIEYWSSRKTIIESHSGTVRGEFALLDLLQIHTSSASVDALVHPKKVDHDHPKPAELTIETNSGTVRAKLPLEGDIPERDYRTRVETSSASIHGSYILGSSASFSSHSGTIDVFVLPYTSDITSLHTMTSSATTKLQLLSPYTRGGNTTGDAAIRNLQSSHKSHSGALRIVYPEEWFGTARAATNAGSIRFRGKDLDRVLGSPSSGFLKHVTMRKGDGNDSSMTLQTQSSSIDARVGDE